MPNELTIFTRGNPIVTKKATDVPISDIRSQKIQTLIRDMQTTLEATKEGIGLAAPQVGVSLRIFIVDEEAKYFNPTLPPPRKDEEEERKKRRKFLVFMNPKILKMSKKKNELPEGCLSVPRVVGTVPRAEKVLFEALDERGKRFKQGANAFYARVIQHEYDHLDGILFTKRAKKVWKPQEPTSKV